MQRGQPLLCRWARWGVLGCSIPLNGLGGSAGRLKRPAGHRAASRTNSTEARVGTVNGYAAEPFPVDAGPQYSSKLPVQEPSGTARQQHLVSGRRGDDTAVLCVVTSCTVTGDVTRAVIS